MYSAADAAPAACTQKSSCSTLSGARTAMSGTSDAAGSVVSFLASVVEPFVHAASKSTESNGAPPSMSAFCPAAPPMEAGMVPLTGSVAGALRDASASFTSSGLGSDRGMSSRNATSSHAR